MNRKLIITKLKNQILTALYENGQVAELHCCGSNLSTNQISLGNIYVGKVKNIVQNIGAAFIEITDGVECYYAINENSSPIFTQKMGKKPLCIGDELLVQVSKEAVKTKVPTVTCNLNFTSKYTVLTHGDTRVGVSSKLAKADKLRLQELVKPFVSDEYGFIIRTNAKDVDDVILINELQRLIKDYQKLITSAKTKTCFSCMKSSPKPYLTELRNVYQEGLSDIVVEDDEIYQEIKEFFENEQPEDLEKLCLYKDKNLPLHKLYSIETEINNALKEHVWLKSGAYLVIQPTEALTVIDVNTGKCISKKKDDNAYLKINLEAAKETARQIRLRNLSGIILIDFINMDKKEYMNELLDIFEKELKKDPVSTSLIDVTQLQLVEVTRKKIRKPFYEAIRE